MHSKQSDKQVQLLMVDTVDNYELHFPWMYHRIHCTKTCDFIFGNYSYWRFNVIAWVGILFYFIVFRKSNHIRNHQFTYQLKGILFWFRAIDCTRNFECTLPLFFSLQSKSNKDKFNSHLQQHAHTDTYNTVFKWIEHSKRSGVEGRKKEIVSAINKRRKTIIR